MPTKQEDRRQVSASTPIASFSGLVTNSDPHDIPPGAATDLRNATPVIPGQLTVRRGTAVVKFDS